MNADQERATAADRLGRRAFFGLVGTAVVTAGAVSAGQSFEVFSATNLVAPRVAGRGPQGMPVNKTAAAAGVLESAGDPLWRLRLDGPTGAVTFSRSELTALPQLEQVLPIACVEGWTTHGRWRGVGLAALLDAVGGSGGHRVRITSLESAGAYRVTTMGPEFATDTRTLAALELNGASLNLDHGFPARIMAPARPGVLQTKWLARIEVLP